MAESVKAARATVIPTLRYRRARTAVDWLCRSFGFEPRLVVPGEGPEEIAHAQLSFGAGMIMLGSARDDDFGRLMTHPDETGGRETMSAYVVVNDVDAHCARATAAGATVVMAPADQDYGGRLYICRDPEGHVRCFGSYDPWA